MKRYRVSSAPHFHVCVLTLTIVRPMQLESSVSLGARKGFCVQWLSASNAAYTLQALDEESRASVKGWIEGLFGDGISDELMQCAHPPSVVSQYYYTNDRLWQLHKPTNPPARRADDLQTVPRGMPQRRHRPPDAQGQLFVFPAGPVELHLAWCAGLADWRDRESGVSSLSDALVFIGLTIAHGCFKTRTATHRPARPFSTSCPSSSCPIRFLGRSSNSSAKILRLCSLDSLSLRRRRRVILVLARKAYPVRVWT